MASNKLFVLDTNVILHDATCIYAFGEHDVVVPLTVLEELDQFKKGHSDINYQAREFLRAIDELTGDALEPAGTSLGDGRGNIRVVWSRQPGDQVDEAFLHDSPDHRILNTSLSLDKQYADRQVVLVSKDTNVRMKAKSLGLCRAGLHPRPAGEPRESVHGQADRGDHRGGGGRILRQRARRPGGGSGNRTARRQ